MRRTNSAKSVRYLQPLTAIWSTPFRVEIGKRYSDTQETTKRTRRKLPTYFPAPHSEQSFRTRVVVDGFASRWAPVTSGVPQGSILGPVLFVIFINDIPEVTVGTSPALFADDTKVYKDVRSVTDCEKLQQTLDKLDTWTQDNNITFNASKCKVLSVTRKKNPITYPHTTSVENICRELKTRKILE
ncbi:Hypothetical predicted protein [Paramuricea clavata]|uniref:Uncharacterized protein n=1 Tax=Paramuricea clavata TaxID=317549 RepID=A0A7D9DTM1_PARCT|nr:Hypothetical predicted protein [Paramuricea clavata]